MSKKNKYAPRAECYQALIFARVSREKQELGSSIDAQLEAIENYCHKHTPKLNIIKKFEFSESSTIGKRKKFYEMLDYVKKQKKKTAIVVHCIDRFQRGFKECTEIEQLLKEDRIEVHFYKEGLVLHKDSSTSDMAQWDFGILSAKLYINSMRDNVKRSMNYNWSQGKWQGLAPIGYLNTRDADNKATLSLDPKAAPIIKKLFEEYATGMHSFNSIYILAKEMRLLTKMKKKLQPVSRGHVYNILQNPFYYGMMRIKNENIKHIYDTIIDKSLFDLVQDIRTGKGRPPNKRGYGEIKFAFSGLIRCTCGCTISCEPHEKKSGLKFVYLRCSHLHGNCNQGLVNENIVLEQLNNEVFNHIHIPTATLENLKSNIHNYIKEQSAAKASIKREITNKLNELKAKERRVLDFYFDGKIDKAVYESQKTEIDAERAELERTSDKYTEINHDIKQTIENVLDVAAQASKIMQHATPHQKRELLGLLLKDCVLDGKTLKYTLQKPFDKLLKRPNNMDWVDVSDASLAELNQLSNGVDVFQKNMRKEGVER